MVSSIVLEPRKPLRDTDSIQSYPPYTVVVYKKQKKFFGWPVIFHLSKKQRNEGRSPVSSRLTL